MQIILNQNDLLKALTPAAGVAAKKGKIEILRNVLIRISDGVMSITGSDTEIELTRQLEVEEGIEVSTTIEAYKFSNLIKTLGPGSDVKIKFDDKYVTITSGRSRFKLATLPSNDYPEIDTGDQTPVCTIKANQLVDLIKKTAFSAAFNDVRNYLNGLLIQFEDGGIKVVGTDGLRLAYKRIDTVTDNAFEGILNKRAYSEIAALASGDEEVTISASDNIMTLVAGDATLCCTMIDGKFPDYQRVIPTKHSLELECSKKELSSALNRALILIDDKLAACDISITAANEIKVSAKSVSDVENEFTDTIEATVTGDSFEISVKADYLLSAVNQLNEKFVNIRMVDSANGIRISESTDSSETIYVVMPVRR